MTDLESSTAPAAELTRWVHDARARTHSLVEDLNERQLLGAKKATVNPIIWALGHISWFQEKWVLRHLGGQPPLNSRVDDLFDSFEVAHEVRWSLDLPSREEILAYMEEVKIQVLERIGRGEPDRELTYFNRLSVLHEDMHCEAITFDRQTLRYPMPRITPQGTLDALGGGPLREDVEVPGAAAYQLGGTPDMPYLFDNEKWAHPVEVRPFRIARTPVTCGEIAEFVEAGGYRNPDYWSLAGKLWLSKSKAAHPIYWRPAKGGGWEQRIFSRWFPLHEHHPATNICWYEAEAYCAWAGRRLPSEAEWELAASAQPGDEEKSHPEKRRYPWGDSTPTPERANLDFHLMGTADVGAFAIGESAFGCRQMVGNVWEWTADAFFPFPGFVVDPYREYSAPWFGYQKVLRGGSWATRSRMIRNTWRNFFLPHRRDILAGFRTCAR